MLCVLCLVSHILPLLTFSEKRSPPPTAEQNKRESDQRSDQNQRGQVRVTTLLILERMSQTACSIYSFSEILLLQWCSFPGVEYHGLNGDNSPPWMSHRDTTYMGNFHTGKLPSFGGLLLL